MAGATRRQSKYMSISAEIRQRINTGELAAGEPIPSLREIVDAWAVSKATAERVHTTLKNDGLVEIRQGARASVKANAPTFSRIQGRAVESATNHSMLRSKEPEHISVNITADVPEFVQHSLETEAGQLVIARGTVTRHGDRVVALSTTYFTSEVARKAPLICGESSIQMGLQAYVAQETGVTVDRACEYSSVRHATDDELGEFGLDGPLPVMDVRRVLSAGDNPFSVTLLVGAPGYQHKMCYDIGKAGPIPQSNDTND